MLTSGPNLRRGANRAHRRQNQRQRFSSSCQASTSRDHVGSLDASGLKIAIVIARFNDLVTKLLLEGALDAFRRHGGAESEVGLSQKVLIHHSQRTGKLLR